MIPPDWVALAGVGRAADLIFQQTSTRNSTEALQGCQHSEKVCTRQTSRTTAHVFLAPDFGEVSGDVTFSAKKIAKKKQYPTVMSYSRKLAQVTKELMTTMKSTVTTRCFILFPETQGILLLVEPNKVVGYPCEVPS